MTLRPYDEVAQEAGIQTLASRFEGIPFMPLIEAYVTGGALKGFGKFWIIGVVAWSFLLFFGFTMFTADSGPPFLLFCGFFIGPIVIGLLMVGGLAIVTSTLLAPPELLITDVALRRNDQLTIRYTQHFKRKAKLKSLAFTLILRESATYQQGTSTVTETHDNVIDERAEFEVPITPDTGIDQELTFTIPADAMHTFEAYRNKLDWILKVQMDIPNFPDYRRIYKLTVLPEVNNES